MLPIHMQHAGKVKVMRKKPPAYDFITPEAFFMIFIRHACWYST
jgi:hypothetical protein